MTSFPVSSPSQHHALPSSLHALQGLLGLPGWVPGLYLSDVPHPKVLINSCLTTPQDMIGSTMLLLSHFSRVWLCATPALGFSRQEHWSGLPFPSPVHKNEKWKWCCSVMSRVFTTPWTAAYQAPPSMGFSRRILEWGAIAFSKEVP